MSEEEKKEVKENANGKEKQFMKLADYYSTSFITDAELKKLLLEKAIDENLLIHIMIHSEFGYVVESAARILSGVKDVNETNITSALITVSLSVKGYQTERQKRIAEMAKQRPDFGEVMQQRVKAI